MPCSAAGSASPCQPMRRSSSPKTAPSPARLGQDVGFREDAHGGAAAHHRRREAGAFLVGPVDQQQRRLGLGAGFVQGAHDLEPGQHAEHAVELAARGLGVEVAADRDRRARRVAALAAEHHVAEAVHRERQADRLAPAAKEMAGLAVEIGQRLAVAAAVRQRADAGHLHQAVPEPLAGQRQVAAGAHEAPPSAPAQPARTLSSWYAVTVALEGSADSPTWRSQVVPASDCLRVRA